MKVLLIIVLFLTLVTDSVLSLDEELLDPFGCNETLFDTKTCHRVSYDYYCTISRSTQDWFRELYNEALADGPRTRKEIRTLDDAERQAYIDAVVALKNDKSVWPNKYDAIAMIHTNRTICSVHKGTNFLGWHRVYLLIFEAALRQKNKNVALPYWASVIDNYMDNHPIPNNSVIFTDVFLGNSDGIVRTGPFKYWKDLENCTLQRSPNFNNSMRLMSPNIIDTIQNNLSVHHMKQIVYDENDDWTTLEGQHNHAHDWVGGMMSILDDSPRDPVFFLHHAFIDYTWTKFIRKQQKLFVEEEYESVGQDVKRHYPNRTMDCFYWLRNVDGLDPKLAANVIYEDSPECPDCGHSKYLKCDATFNICIPDDKTETAGTNRVYPLWQLHVCLLCSLFYHLFL
ncbi:tyrosinase-like protein 2 [Ostrea edulis]|uniref:tyrosinase-like protein 2 n=1 Tax=Ostrea edulis TaxID=37623 RepID=UPI0024AF8BA0|nr:tyrosinase-like protein 2 [Ostrea edulis]